MIVKLWDNKNEEHGLFESMEEAYKQIQRYTVANKIDVFYYRQNLLKDGTIMVDYGSHTHLFYMKEIDDSEETPYQNCETC